MNIFIELLVYVIIGTLVGGVAGSFIPSLIWILVATAAVIILPPTIFGKVDKNPAHPGKQGIVAAGFMVIIGCVIGLWVGYLFF